MAKLRENLNNVESLHKLAITKHHTSFIASSLDTGWWFSDYSRSSGKDAIEVMRCAEIKSRPMISYRTELLHQLDIFRHDHELKDLWRPLVSKTEIRKNWEKCFKLAMFFEGLSRLERAIRQGVELEPEKCSLTYEIKEYNRIIDLCIYREKREKCKQNPRVIKQPEPKILRLISFNKHPEQIQRNPAIRLRVVDTKS